VGPSSVLPPLHRLDSWRLERCQAPFSQFKVISFAPLGLLAAGQARGLARRRTPPCHIRESSFAFAAPDHSPAPSQPGAIPPFRPCAARVSTQLEQPGGGHPQRPLSFRRAPLAAPNSAVYKLGNHRLHVCDATWGRGALLPPLLELAGRGGDGGSLLRPPCSGHPGFATACWPTAASVPPKWLERQPWLLHGSLALPERDRSNGWAATPPPPEFL